MLIINIYYKKNEIKNKNRSAGPFNILMISAFFEGYACPDDVFITIYILSIYIEET